MDTMPEVTRGRGGGHKKKSCLNVKTQINVCKKNISIEDK
jgi:hypothetical protein